MAIVPLNLIPISISIPTFFILATNFCLALAIIDVNSTTTTQTPPLPPPSPTPYTPNTGKVSPFKPSMAVIVAVLTTMFSVTFLLLLYAKHCKRGGYGYGNNNGNIPPSSMRKNSGIDRSVIESLPIFRFSSLRGLKDGLECAVCLNRFEPTEVLRLLPKCNHAFHVECVDTWLDAHSTCPLCRYRVDPEDILLVEQTKFLHENQPIPPPPPTNQPHETITDQMVNPSYHRVSGRHSSAGEKGNKFLKILLHKRVDPTTSSRRSLDSRANEVHKLRKDGLLLMKEEEDRKSFERRFGHRIVISDSGSGLKAGQRWSDVQPSDLLYLRSEMIMSNVNNSRGCRSSSSNAVSRSVVGIEESGRSVINTRSMSEITGMSRRGKEEEESRRQRQVAGVVSRWLAYWISPNNYNRGHSQLYASSSSTYSNQQLPL